jgi:biotin-(acetyl-CoA carboxylase) ligase
MELLSSASQESTKDTNETVKVGVMQTSGRINRGKKWSRDEKKSI